MKRNLSSLLYAAILSSSVLYAEGHDELSQKANDPTASLMAVQIADWYTEDYYNGLAGESSNTVVLRAAYPYRWGEFNHIARVTQPIATDTPSGDTGLTDMTLFDMVVTGESWGRWGVGLVGSIPLDSENKQWTLGPAFGFVNNTMTKGLNLGIFNQNLFRIAGDDDRPYTQISSLQPIVNYSMGGGWNIGTGEIQYLYDWESSQWVSLPIAFQVGKLVKFGKLPVIFSAQYEHDFADEVDIGNGLFAPISKNTLRFTAKLLFPTF